MRDRWRAAGAKALPALLTALCDAGYSVSLETSGALDISAVDPRVARIMDLKAPSSTSLQNRLENLAGLRQSDEIKIVLADEADYRWAHEMIHAQNLADRCPVLLSPVQGELSPASQILLEQNRHSWLWQVEQKVSVW